jgi:hypothetical protein
MLLAARECSNTSSTSFQLEKTRTLAVPSVEVILNILLVTASIFTRKRENRRWDYYTKIQHTISKQIRSAGTC